jgi:hypothetical protein
MRLFRQKTEFERFRAFLESEASGTPWSSDPHRTAQLEDEKETARIILDFARQHNGEITTVQELVEIVSPPHEGWGLDRRVVDDWVWRFQQQQPNPRRR